VIYLRKYPSMLPCGHTVSTMTDPTSTARRRELGAELRRIREQRGFNGLDLATRLSWTTTRLSRAETGKRPMTELEVSTYTAMCGVAGNELDELLALANEPDDHRLKSHEGRIPDELRTLIFHESTATEIDTVEPIYIPGLLQTEDHARALLHELGIDDLPAIENYVRIRMNRRAVLTKVCPPQCTFYVHEHVLRSMVGTPQVMYEQMLHMLFMDTRPQCSIRVIPSAAAARGSAAGSFHIFGYSEGSPVVCVQHETTTEFLESRKDLAGYRAVLKRVASVALNEGQSRQFISQMASDYEQGAARHDDGGSTGVAQEQP
jgi:transcriptional regulator with XRE-family HTH domain